MSEPSFLSARTVAAIHRLERRGDATTIALAFVDTYEITRTTTVPDGSGGTTTTETVVESLTVGDDFPNRGRCSLEVAQHRGTEAPAGGGVVVSIATYTALLPIETVLAAADTLTINGRDFAVIDVKRGGELDAFAEATLEARG